MTEKMAGSARAALEARHRVEEYVRRIAEAKRDENDADDFDDRIGARHRVERETQWLGKYVYENARVLGLVEE